MTIDEAIENIMEVLKLDCYVKYPEWQDALRLGIEALQRVKHVREKYQKSSYVLLPGETNADRR